MKAMDEFQALVFDFEYSDHKGVILYVRIFRGSVVRGDTVHLLAGKKSFRALEVGIFNPEKVAEKKLSAGEIGYIVTGIKEPGIARVGDTVASDNTLSALAGYQEPRPVVWASVYPESQDDFDALRLALQKLQLSDSSLSFAEEVSGVLGRGFRLGLLGMLHLEIVAERLRREFTLDLVVTMPGVTYRIEKKDGKEIIAHAAHTFPDEGVIDRIYEPWVEARIIVPSEYSSALSQLFFEHESEIINTENFGHGRVQITINLPMRELMRNFFDNMKSLSSGHASLSYETIGERQADVTKLEIIIADETVPAFAKIISRARAQQEAEELVEKLSENLPREQFAYKIQGKALGRILASRAKSAFRKDVTAKLYGGDITRKMKLREKQKKGKKKMSGRGVVNIDGDVFLKVMKR